jgi:hypothetical protein
MELEPWVVLESMEVLELWVELMMMKEELELKEPVLVLELMMMKLMLETMEQAID